MLTFRFCQNEAIFTALDVRYSLRRTITWFRDCEGGVVIVDVPSIVGLRVHPAKHFTWKAPRWCIDGQKTWLTKKGAL